MTASFFAESSHVPLLVRVAVSPSTLTHEWIRESRAFGISVLARGQEEIAWFCGAHSGRGIAKLERLGLRWRMDPHGIVLVPNAFSTSACRVVEEVELTDHTLFVGEIVASFRQSMQSSRAPLLVSELAAASARA